MLRKFTFQICRVAIGALLVPSLAFAAVNLKKVSIVDGNQIELLFDGKVDPAQVKTEFVRDNIQLSLSNASVYPAKVSMVSGSELTKVFAYQYSPALVRARFTMKGDAANYANRLQVKISGKTVTVKISAGKAEEVAATSSSALRVASAPEAEKESKSVLEKVAESASPAKAVAAEAPKAADSDKNDKNEKNEKNEKADKKGSRNLTGSQKSKELAAGKSLPSPFRSIGVMLFVLGIFGLFVMFLKRLKGGEGKSLKGAKGLGGLLTKLSGGTTAKALIEVVATHHLAPKRSIVVVRIQDRMLVLGMTNDSMNLITEFRANEEGDAEDNIPLGDFAASLKKFESEGAEPAVMTKISPKANLGDIAAAALGLAKPKPASAPRATAAASAYQNVGTNVATAASAAANGPSFNPALAEAMKQPAVKQNIRAQIKDRVQGMKQL